MDDDSRSSKKPFYGALRSGSRNPHSVSDTKMYDRRHLKDENVEKYVYFAGVINDIAPHTDITNRTDVLRIIDKGKQQRSIGMHPSRDKLAIFSLSVSNIKLIPCSSEDLPIFLRIPMQEIAAICYIKDDGQNILAVKHGSMELCHLAVLYCDSKSIAEEICALVDQCFQLIYMDAVFNIIDPDGRDSSRSNSTSSGNQFPSFITNSLPDIHHQASRTPSFRRPVRVPSEGNSDGGSISAEELCRDYMMKLHQKLDAEELRQFASLLPDTQSKTNFGDFCEKVLELYGPERKHLLSDMSPFIPSDNYPHFEEFLRRNGIQPPDSGTLSSIHSNPVMSSGIYSRSVSDISGSTLANGSESLEHLMRIMSDVNRIDESNDVDYNPDNFMPGIDYN